MLESQEMLFHLWSEDPLRRKWQPIPVFWLSTSHRQRSLVASVHGDGKRVDKAAYWLNNKSTQTQGGVLVEYVNIWRNFKTINCKMAENPRMKALFCFFPGHLISFPMPHVSISTLLYMPILKPQWNVCISPVFIPFYFLTSIHMIRDFIFSLAMWYDLVASHYPSLYSQYLHL